MSQKKKKSLSFKSDSLKSIIKFHLMSCNTMLKRQIYIE